MRFKIRNELGKADYERLIEFLKARRGLALEVFQGTDLKFAVVQPVKVSMTGSIFQVDVETSFTDPIGFKVADLFQQDAGVDVRVNRRNIKLTAQAADQEDLPRSLDAVLRMVELVVSAVLTLFNEQVVKRVTLEPEYIDSQIEERVKNEELAKRGETPRPYSTIHAQSFRDAKQRAGDLIPLYKERDKAYLYDAKQVYYLLPHNFANTLLRCDESTMMQESEFDSESREVLKDLVYKKNLKKRKLLNGTVCYWLLDQKTRRHLKKHLQQKKSRF